MSLTYKKIEVARLHVGDEFIDQSDIPHIVTGFEFLPNSLGHVILMTNHWPKGKEFDTLEIVWVKA